MRDPLLPPFLAIAAGIVLAHFVPFQAREAGMLAAVFAILGIFSLWHGTRRVAGACCLLSLIPAGILLELTHRPPPTPQVDAQPNETVVLSGCVVEPPTLSEDRQQVTLEIAPGACARVSFFLKESEQPPDLRFGQRVEVEARIRAPHNFGNPGSFDYTGYLARQNVYWTASARRNSPVRVLGNDCGSPFRAAIFALRVKALDRLDALFRNQPYERGISRAILIGDSARLEQTWKDSFRRTGTYHALVISGLHIAVLAGFFLFLLRLLRVGEMPALITTAISAWLYALVTGWTAPVVRSAGGFTLFLICRYFYRKGRLLNLVAATALGFLILDPVQLLEASFQLSFLSVVAIAVLAVPLAERFTSPYARGLSDLTDTGRDLHLPPRTAQFRVEMRLLAQTIASYTRLPLGWILRVLPVPAAVVFWVLELFLVSASVQLGLALPMVVYFHRISISGLLANTIVVPLLTWAVPVGMLAILTGWWLPAQATSVLLLFSRRVVEWHANWEPGWRIPDPPLWLALCFTASLLALPFAIRRGRAIRWVDICCTVALFTCLVIHPFAPQAQTGGLELTAIDVGQGDSLFAALPDGKLMLVDAGGFASYGRRHTPGLDTGEDVVGPYLWSRSIRRLDAVAVSHPDADHIGGMSAILRNFHPRDVWVGGIPNNEHWRNLEAAARETGARIIPMWAGRHFSYGGAQWEVLSPSKTNSPFTDVNDESLILRLTHGERSFLLTGDMERRLEYYLVEQGLQKTDVLKVGHHGSKTSSSQPFLDALKPSFALISVGYQNSYGHPSREVLERLENEHTLTLRTDLEGLITIRTDGHRIEVESSRWGEKPRRLYSAF